MGGAAQDPSQQRGGVKDPHRGPGPILERRPAAWEGLGGALWGNLGAGGRGGGPGSVSRMVVEPGLKVTWAGEIEQILGQLLQMRQGQGGEALLAGLIQTAESSNQLADGERGGLLLPPLLQDLLNSTGVAQFLQRQTNDHQDLLSAEQGEPLEQHRENDRLQILPALQNSPAALPKLLFRSHRQGEQIDRRIEVLLLTKLIEAPPVHLRKKAPKGCHGHQ